MMYCVNVTTRDLMKRFQQAGWVVVRTTGSQHVYGKNGVTFPVPYHGKGADAAKHIVRDALRLIEEVG